ncbi:MFS transporter [Nocardia cyriacigeorgica]|uniref:MFS transporter n=1 Tax=Nocardia cyriacigeorgica TaxID=135487 RepID=UPI002456702D|nr:MFS transporter [Nocardia cyriacigeorgica]
MGARLPDNIPPWAAEIVVGHIPECDVAGLRRCADAWAAAESLTELADELEAAVEKRLRATAMEGDTAAAVAQQVKAIAADMRAVGKGCAALSRSSHQAATTLELQQYLAVGIAIAVTAQVTASLALFATGGSVMIAAQRIAARETVVLGWRNMMAVLAQQLARGIVRFPRSAMVVGATALGMGTGGAVNWGAQRKQIADGHRTGVDWGQVGVAVAAGGAGGAVGAPVGRATALAIIRQISAQAPRHTRIGAQVAATVAAGATGGLAGAAAGTVVAALAGGQDLRRQDLLNALIPGLGSGVVTALGSSLHAIRATAAGTAVSDSVAGRHTRFDFPSSPPAERPFADGSTPHSVDPTADHMSKGLSTQRRSEGERIAERLAGRIDLDPDSYRGPAREFAAYLRERYGDTSGSHGTAGSVAHEAGTRLYGSASDTSAMPGKAGAVFPSHSPETAAPASGHPDRSAAVAAESGHPAQTTTVTAAPDTPRAQSSTASDPARTESTADGTPIAPTTAPDGPTVPEFSRTPEQTNPQFDDNGSTPGGFTDTQLGSITPFDSGDPSPATRYGAAAHDTTDWFRPGQMNCVPEAVADTAAATGTRVDTGALPTDAGTRGVMMDDYLIALRADTRPGGWPSFQALFDDVAQNRSHVAAAAQFAYGAHAFTVKSTQPGHFVIHEKSPILARNPGDPAVAVIRDTYSDGRVVEQNVDAVGNEVGALRQYDVPDAIDRWTEKFGRVTIIAGAEYFRVPGTEDRWSAALPLGENELPGGPDGLRHGLDVPSTHIGSDAAVLDHLAPAEVGLSPDVVALRFAEIARGLDASDSASPSPRRGDTDSADAPATTPLTDAAATGNATRVHSTPSPDSGPVTPVSAVAESDLGTAANDRSTPALAAFAPGHEVTGDIAAPTRVRPIEPSGPVADGVAYPLVERSASSGAVEPESVTPRDTARDTEADPNGGARQSGRFSPWMTADSAAEESSPPTTPTATRPLTAAAEPEELRPQVPGPLIPTPQPALIPDPTRHSITYPMEHATEFEQPAPPAFPNPSFPDSDDREETANQEPVIPREISESGRDIRADRPRFQPHDPSAEAETEERSPATEAPATPWTAPPQRFPATPPSHLPSAPPAGPAEAEVTRRHFPVRPDENTPGAPTDPARRPGLNPHSLSYNSPESDIPQHATRPGALPAPPPGDPVTPARPAPSMQASLDPSEPARPRGRRKPQRQELEPALHDSTPPIVRQPGPEDVARPAQSRAPVPGWESPTLPDAPGSESVLEWRAKLARRADAEAVLAGLEKIWNYLRFDESTKFDPQTGYRAILVPSNPDSGTVAVLVNWLAEHPEHHDTPIIFSGWRPPGAKSPLPEALLFLQQAQQLGLWHDPAISDRVILDPDATNSKQNAEFFQMALSARFGVDARVPVVLVCSPQHSRRIMATVTMHAPVVGDLATVSLDVPFTTYLTDGLRPDPADPTPIDDIVVPVLRELRGIVERSRNGEIAAQHVPAAVLAEFHRAAAVFPQVFEREIKPLVEAALGKGTQAAEAITAIYESAQARVAELAAPGRAADFADLHTGTTHWASEFGAWAADRFAPWARPLATATGLEWAFALSTLTEADRGAVGRLFLDQQYAHMPPADEVIAAAEPGIRQLARHIAIHVDKPELVRRVAAIVGDPAVALRIAETAVERAGEGATEPVADIARELAIEHGRFARFRQALKAAMVQDFRLSSPLIDQATPGEWTEALAALSQRQRAYLDARYREGMEPFDIRVQFDLGDEDLDALAGLHLSLTNAVASRSEPEDAPTAESAAIQVSIAGLGPEVEYAPLGVDGKRMPEAVARALVDAADTAPVMMKGNSAVLRVLQDQAGRLWVARHVHDTVLDPLDSKPLSARDVYEELAPLKTGAPDLYATVSNGTDEWEIFDFKHGVPVTEQREAAVAALDDLHRALRPTAIGFRDAGALLREMVAEKRRVLDALRTELGPFFDAMEVPENPFELVLELSWTLGPVLAQRIHGDAHFGNTRIDAEGRIVFLDWEMARDGDPRYDKNRMAFLEGLESDGDYVYAYRLFLSIQRLVDDIVRLGRAAAAGLLTSEQIRFAGAQLEWALFSAGPAWRGQERTGIRSIVERLGVFDPPPAEWNGPAVPPVPTSPRQPAPAEAAESSRAGDDVADLIPRTVQATPRDGAATPPAVAFPTGHEIGFADLEEWADRLSDRDLDHALTSLHSSALDLLGRFHTGEQVSAASLFSVARALNAAVAERSYRLSDDAPNLATIDNADLAILGRKLADDAVAAGQLYRAAATIVQMTATTASGDIGRGRDFAGRFARMAYRVGYAADHVSRYEREQRSPDAAPARLELAPLRAANNAINPEPRHDHAAAYVEHGDPVPSSYHTAEYAAEADCLLRSGLAEGFGSALLTATGALPGQLDEYRHRTSASDTAYARAAADLLRTLYPLVQHHLRAGDTVRGLDHLEQIERVLSESRAHFPAVAALLDAETTVAEARTRLTDLAEFGPPLEHLERMAAEAARAFADNAPAAQAITAASGILREPSALSPHPPSHENAASASTRHIDMLTREINGILGADRVNGAGRDTPDLVAQVFELAGAHDRATLLSTATRLATEHRSFRHFRQALLVSLTNHAGAAPAASEVQALETSSREQLETALATLSGIERDYLTVRFAQGRSRPKTMALLRAEHGTGPLGRPRTLERAAVRRLAARLAQSVGEGGRAADDMRLPPAPAVRGQEPPAEYRPLGGPPGARGMPTDVATLLLQQGLSRLAPGERRDVVVGGGQFVLHFPDQSADISESEVYRHDTARGVQTRHAYEVFENVTLPDGSQAGRVLLLENVEGATPLAELADKPILAAAKLLQDTHFRTRFGERDRPAFISRLIAEENAKIAAQAAESADALAELGVPAEPFAPIQRWAEALATSGRWWSRRVSFALLHFGDYNDLLQLPDGRLVIGNPAHARPGDELLDFVRLYYHAPLGREAELLKAMVSVDPDAFDQYLKFVRTELILRGVRELSVAAAFGMLTSAQIAFARTELMPALRTSRLDWGQSPELRAEHLFKALGVWTPPGARQTERPHAETASATAPVSGDTAQPAEPALPDLATATTRDLLTWAESLSLPRARQLLTESLSDTVAATTAYHGARQQARELADSARVLNAVIAGLFRKLTDSGHPIVESRFTTDLLDDGALAALVSALAPWAPVAHDMHDGVRAVLDAIRALGHQSALPGALSEMATPYEEVAAALSKVTLAACRSQRIHSGRITYPSAIDRGFLTEKIERAMTVTAHALQEPSLAKVADRFLVSRNRSHPAAGPGTSPGPEVSFHDAFDLPYRSGTPWSRSGRNARRTALQEAIWYAYDERLSPDARAGENPRSQAAAVDVPPSSGTVPATSVDKPATLPPTPDTTPAPLAATYENASVPDALEHPDAIAGHKADEPAGPPRPTGVIPELGADVDALVTQSPTLTTHITELRAAGWTFDYGPTGEGSYADRDLQRIVIDSRHRDNPYQTTWTLSEEASIATSPHPALETGPQGRPAETWLEAVAVERQRAEAEAQLFAYRIDDEIHHGHPTITPFTAAGPHHYTIDKNIYNQLTAGYITRDDALNELANANYHHARRRETTHTFTTYWHTRFTRHHPPAIPTSTHYRRINEEMILAHQAITGASTFDYYFAPHDPTSVAARSPLPGGELFPRDPAELAIVYANDPDLEPDAWANPDPLRHPQVPSSEPTATPGRSATPAPQDPTADPVPTAESTQTSTGPEPTAVPTENVSESAEPIRSAPETEPATTDEPEQAATALVPGETETRPAEPEEVSPLELLRKNEAFKSAFGKDLAASGADALEAAGFVTAAQLLTDDPELVAGMWAAINAAGWLAIPLGGYAADKYGPNTLPHKIRNYRRWGMTATLAPLTAAALADRLSPEVIAAAVGTGLAAEAAATEFYRAALAKVQEVHSVAPHERSAARRLSEIARYLSSLAVRPLGPVVALNPVLFHSLISLSYAGQIKSPVDSPESTVEQPENTSTLRDMVGDYRDGARYLWPDKGLRNAVAAESAAAACWTALAGMYPYALLSTGTSLSEVAVGVGAILTAGAAGGFLAAALPTKSSVTAEWRDKPWIALRVQARKIVDTPVQDLFPWILAGWTGSAAATAGSTQLARFIDEPGPFDAIGMAVANFFTSVGGVFLNQSIMDRFNEVVPEEAHGRAKSAKKLINRAGAAVGGPSGVWLVDAAGPQATSSVIAGTVATLAAISLVQHRITREPRENTRLQNVIDRWRALQNTPSTPPTPQLTISPVPIGTGTTLDITRSIFTPTDNIQTFQIIGDALADLPRTPRIEHAVITTDDHPTSGLAQTSLDGVAQLKYPRASDPWPAQPGRVQAAAIIPELGPEVADLVAKSPTLLTRLTELHTTGWTFTYGPAGEGSYADRDNHTVIIDSTHQNTGNPEQITWHLARQTSIAISPSPARDTGPQHGPVEKWFEAVITEHMRTEAEAELFAYESLHEIEHPRHPHTGHTWQWTPGDRWHTINKEIHDRLARGDIDRDEALNHIAASAPHRRYRLQSTHSFPDYWKTRYTNRHPEADPSEAQFLQITETLLADHIVAISGTYVTELVLEPSSQRLIIENGVGELFPPDTRPLEEQRVVYAYHRGRSAQAHDPSPTRPQESNPSTPTTTPPPATDHAPPSPGGSHPDTTGPGQDRTSFAPGPTNPLAPQPHRVIGKHPAHERLQQGLAYHHDQNENDPRFQNENDPRFWERPKPRTETPSRAEAEGDETPDPAEISTTAEPSAPAPTESVTDGAEQAVPAPHLEPSDDAPAAPGEDSSTLNSIRQEFGPDVADLVAKSPTLLTRLAELRSAEWAFAYGPAGKGSYADRDNRTLNIDSRHQETGDLEQTVWDLAEQASIAASPSPALDTGPGHRPVQEWHEAVAAEYLRADTEGKLFAFGVQEEIEHAQGSPWNLTERFTHGDHRHRLNKAIYDRFTQGRIDLDDALNEIAANYSDHPQLSTGTFPDYWETRYTSRFSEAAPTEEQFRKIMQTLTVDQSLSNEDFPYFMDNDPRDLANDTKLFPPPPGARPLARQDVVYAFDPDLPDDAHAKKQKKPAPDPSSAAPDGDNHNHEDDGHSKDAEPAREEEAAPAPGTNQVPSHRDIVSTGELLKENPDYRKLVVSNGFTEFGNNLQLFVLPLLAADATGSYETMGWVMATASLSKVIFEIPAGYLTDILGSDLRRKLMVGMQFVGGLGAGGAACVVIFDVPNPGLWLTTAAAVDATAATFYKRLLGGTVLTLVTDPAHRARANSLTAVQNYVAGIGARALGPFVWGLDKLAVFVVNGATFAWNAAMIHRIRDRLPVFPRQEHKIKDIGRELGAGWQALWQVAFLRRYTAVITLTNLAAAAFNGRAIAVVNESTMPDWIDGLILTAGAIGGAASAPLAKLTAKIDVDKLFLGTLAGFAATAGVQAATANPFVIATGNFFFSALAVSMNASLSSYQQQNVHKDLINRVISIDQAVTGVGTAAGGAIAGQLLAAQGVEVSGWMPAAVVGAAAAGVGLHYVINRWRAIRRTGHGQLYSPPTLAPTISPTPIGAAAGNIPFGTLTAGSASARTFRVIGKSVVFPGTRARIGRVFAESALPTGSALAAPATRSASSITETTLDGVSHWKYPQRSDPWPTGNRRDPAPARVPELGADVDALVAQSPTLTAAITQLRAAGWTFHYGPTGEGSYAYRDKRRIIIDSRHRDNPHQVTWTLSEETAIATAPHPALDAGPQGQPFEKWLEAVAVERQQAEAEAQLFAKTVRHEVQWPPATAPIIAAGPRNYLIHKRIYDEPPIGGSDRDNDDARLELLRLFAADNYNNARIEDTPHAFDTYWRTRYTGNHPIPDATDYARTVYSVITDHHALADAFPTFQTAPSAKDSLHSNVLPGNALFPRLTADDV